MLYVMGRSCSSVAQWSSARTVSESDRPLVRVPVDICKIFNTIVNSSSIIFDP